MANALGTETRCRFILKWTPDCPITLFSLHVRVGGESSTWRSVIQHPIADSDGKSPLTRRSATGQTVNVKFGVLHWRPSRRPPRSSSWTRLRICAARQGLSEIRWILETLVHSCRPRRCSLRVPTLLRCLRFGLRQRYPMAVRSLAVHRFSNNRRSPVQTIVCHRKVRFVGKVSRTELAPSLQFSVQLSGA